MLYVYALRSESTDEASRFRRIDRATSDGLPDQEFELGDCCWLGGLTDEAFGVAAIDGIEQLDRGEGIPQDQLDAHLAKVKSQPK
jgi:hypothetical protein